MGRNGLLDASKCCLLLDHDEYHDTCEMGSATIQKHIIFLAWLDFHLITVDKPHVQLSQCFGRDGYQTFLRPLTYHAYILFIYIEIGKAQIHQFTHTQTAREQHFDDCLIAMSLPFREVDGVLQHIYFCSRQHLRQMLSQHGILQQFRRVVIAPSVQLHKTIETTYATQNTALRIRSDAYFVKCSRKMLQVVQLHIVDGFLFPLKIMQQFFQIAQVSLHRIR